MKRVAAGSSPVGDPGLKVDETKLFGMSYQSRKTKQCFWGRIRYWFGLVKIALLKSIKRNERRKEKSMRLRQTNVVMAFLRKKTKTIRPNNLRVSEWVDEYVNRCALEGRPVEILTQLCISKDLEMRYREQGNSFVPTKKERLLFEKEIPRIAYEFQKNGIACSWWVTFNQSYLDSGRITGELRDAYVKLITGLAEPLLRQGWLMLADWETDILMKRSEPSENVLVDVDRFVKPGALQIEIERHSAWAREEAGLTQSDDELRRDVYLQIACEAEEGRFIASEAPFGECILVPLEAPERYDFFTIFAPDFKRLIVAILPPYPWRLKGKT